MKIKSLLLLPVKLAAHVKAHRRIEPPLACLERRHIATMLVGPDWFPKDPNFASAVFHAAALPNDLENPESGSADSNRVCLDPNQER